MDELLVDELMRRVQRLEQDKQRWKLIAVSALLMLVLAIFGGGVLMVGTASLYTFQVREDQMRALEERAQLEAMRAQQAEQEARRQAERARQMQNEKDGK